MTSAQIKNSFSGIGELDAAVSPSTLILKLCVTQSAIRYFVLSRTHNQIVFAGDYTLHHINNTIELSERLEKIFEKDEILQLPFSEILVAFDGNYSLAPAQLSSLLKTEGQLLQNCGAVDLLFECPAVLQNSVRELFADAKLLHLNSSYFKLFTTDSKEEDRLFVNVATGHLDIIRFNGNGELLLMNRYECKAATDFMYFLLLVCEEMKIDREKVVLVLLGEIGEESSIYQLCYRYFRFIRFEVQPVDISFSKAFDNFPKHLHYSLYNL